MFPFVSFVFFVVSIHRSLIVQRFREIWWVRHAESLGNVGARTREPGTYSLTARGFAQAETLARWFERRPALIVASGYTRARETAALVIARHHECPVVEWPVHEINFLAPARAFDTTQIERRTLAEDFWARWDPHFVDGEGAESFAGFIARADDALARARRCAEPFVAVFTHGLFMRGIIWRALHPDTAIDAAGMKMFQVFSRGAPLPNCAVLPMLLAEDGTAFLGPIRSPIADAEDTATLEHFR